MPYQNLNPIESYLGNPSHVEIECRSRLGLPSIQIVGLASRELLESRERLSSALNNLGVEFPRKRFTLNLRPAAIRKPGTGCELALGLALLREAKLFRPECRTIAAWGEMSLTGEVLETPGVVPAFLSAWKRGSDEFWTSVQNRAVLESVLGSILKFLPGSGPRLRWIGSLKDALNPPPSMGAADLRCRNVSGINLIDQVAPFAQHFTPETIHLIATAAAGAHGLVLVGPKGTGKTTAVQLLQRLLPPISGVDWLERMEHLGFQDPQSIAHTRPLIASIPSQARPSHLLKHQASHLGILDRAHNGILFADEFPELHRDTRETLRSILDGASGLPFEDRIPKQVQWFAAGNLCPCGGLPREFNPDPDRDQCRCSRPDRVDYLRRWSGPILDRTDLAGVLLPSRRRVSEHMIQELPVKIERVRAWSHQLWEHPPAQLSFAEFPEALMDHAARDRGLSTRDQLKRARIAVTLFLLTQASTLCGTEPPAILAPNIDWTQWLQQAGRLRPETVLFQEGYAAKTT